MPPKAAQRSGEAPMPSPSLPSPPPADVVSVASPSHSRDVRYFDAVHLILLSHIRRSNSNAVMALLSLPAVGGDELFWQTCTYRAGIVSAMVQYVMEHSGQTRVALPTTTENTVKVESAQQHSSSSSSSSVDARSPADTTPSPSSLQGATSAVCESGREDTLGFSAECLHGLLHHCLHSGPCGASVVLNVTSASPGGAKATSSSSSSSSSSGAPSISDWGRVLAAFHFHSDDSAAPDWHEGFENSSDVPQLLLPPQRRAKKENIGAVSPDNMDLRLYLESVVRELRRMMDGRGAATTTATSATPTSSPPPLVDLTALVAVLQEHCATFTYTNPLAPATAAQVHNSSSSDTAAVEALPPEAGEKDTPVVVDDVDAVAMLQRLPALSATRWTLPDEGKTSFKPPLEKPHARPATTAVPPATQRDTSTTLTAAQQRDAEAHRVSAAIRAFDAFTAALSERPPAESDGSTGFVAAQRHREKGASVQSHVSSSNIVGGGTGAAAAQNKGHTPPTLSEAHAHAPPAAVAPLPPLPLAPPPPRTSNPPAQRVIKRRNKFSAEEDTAITHGVARFGQGAGAFQYIFHAYRNVWRHGRTAIHLYDHWRDALRRRSVAAVSAEALQAPQTVAEDGEGNREGHEEMADAAAVATRTSSPRKRARSGATSTPARGAMPLDWASQGLSSEIEDSSVGSAEA